MTSTTAVTPRAPGDVGGPPAHARRPARRGRPTGSCGRRPRSRRPCGITFICGGSPARSTVGVTHTRPRWGCSPWRVWSSDSRSASAVSTAPAARLGLRPWNGMAPWAIFPVRSMRRRRAPLATWQISPPSGSQQMAASTPSVRPRATKSLAPIIMPSSSTSAPRTRRPGKPPRRQSSSAAKSIAATPPFMSAAPRPQMRPSASSAPNGSWLHWSRLPSVTTSRWPSNINVGPGRPPSMVATTLGRPGATTSISGSQPKARICSTTSSAAGSSSRPRAGSKTLGIWTSRRVKSTSASPSMAIPGD